MNKLVSTCYLALALTLSACSSSEKNETVTAINTPPTIAVDEVKTVSSGETLTLNATISDPDGDSLNVVWSSDNTELSFSTTSESSTVVTFPVVTKEQAITLTVTATDEQGSSAQHEMVVNVIANEPIEQGPVITLAESQQANAGQSILLIAEVKNAKEGDLVLAWQSNHDGVSFSARDIITPTITLPDVDSETQISITLTATDIENVSSQKTLTLTVVPNTSALNIELTERSNGVSGDEFNIAARLLTNSEISEIDWDISSLGVNENSINNVTFDTETLTSVSFTLPTVSEYTEFPVTLTVTLVDGTEFSQTTTVVVTSEEQESLSVDLPELIEVNENSTINITPVIEHTSNIDSFAWSLNLSPEATLITPNSEILSLSTPEIDVDTEAQLELTVIMGELTRTTSTTLLVKNVQVASDIEVSASKLILVEGQTVALTVHTDNLEQIKEWSWTPSNTLGLNVKESKSAYEMTAPKVSGQQTMSVAYRATRFDGTEILKVANITVLSMTMARSTFDFDITIDRQIVQNDVEKTIVLDFADPHGLIDSLSLDQSLTFNTFDKAELSYSDQKISLVLKPTDVILSSADYLSINIHYGNHVFQYPVYLYVEKD